MRCIFSMPFLCLPYHNLCRRGVCNPAFSDMIYNLSLIIPRYNGSGSGIPETMTLVLHAATKVRGTVGQAVAYRPRSSQIPPSSTLVHCLNCISFIMSEGKGRSTIQRAGDRIHALASTLTGGTTHGFPAFDDLPKVEGQMQGCCWGLFDKDGKKDEIGSV